MRIIISPAKKMVREVDLLEPKNVPIFIEEASSLLTYMKGLTYIQCKELFKCNDKIAQLNYDRFQNMDLAKQLTPAVLSYEGIQYQYMAPQVMEQDALDYIEEHLRIISGFYGILRPLDGIVPYRLEMQSKLINHTNKTLYEFWGEKLANQLKEETDCILNLASKEYSKGITKYLKDSVKVITCQFGELMDGKVKEKSPYVKMARGEMVRYLAENAINDMEGVKCFDRLGYGYASEYSSDDTFVFLQKNQK